MVLRETDPRFGINTHNLSRTGNRLIDTNADIAPVISARYDGIR